MHDKEQLCEKIRSIYPDIGECGIDLDVSFDKDQDVWVVDLKKDNNRLKHYLEKDDARLCLEGKQCVSLGIDIAQLRDNIQEMG